MARAARLLVLLAAATLLGCRARLPVDASPRIETPSAPAPIDADVAVRSALRLDAEASEAAPPATPFRVELPVDRLRDLVETPARGSAGIGLFGFRIHCDTCVPSGRR